MMWIPMVPKLEMTNCTTKTLIKGKRFLIELFWEWLIHVTRAFDLPNVVFRWHFQEAMRSQARDRWHRPVLSMAQLRRQQEGHT
jgi:hypothetical protein